MASTSKDKGKKRKNEAAKDNDPTHKKQTQANNNGGCFFCNMKGHVKKECAKYIAWRAKKGTFLTLVCSEVNLASIPRNTWWLDSGVIAKISVSMQGCLSYRKPSDAERSIYVGDDKLMNVETIGHFRLLLSNGYYLDLIYTFVAPSFRQNLFPFLVWTN